MFTASLNRTLKTASVAGAMLLAQSAFAAGSYTIEFEYHPETVGGAVPHAVTRHYDSFRSPVDTVDTVLFTDGLKRVVQTKKDQTVNGADMMTVSGRVVFDFIGRVKEQRYPTASPKGMDRTFIASPDSVTPTRYTYDQFGRTVRIVGPYQTLGGR